MIAYAPRPADDLRADVRASAANLPGVYRMVGPANNVLYVGKSIRVRARLLSYFRAGPDEKAAEIIRHTHRIEWDYVPSEFHALLTEMRLIQQWRPPFNVEHKRQRAFCFVKVTREEAPRLVVSLEVGDDRAHYYGPFRGRERVREMVREVRDLLELRDCKPSTPVRFADQMDLFGVTNDAPLCIRGEVQKCLAPCAARCTRSDYDARMALARRFLDGDVDTPLAILRARMDDAARRMQFEYAADVRDRAARLEMARDELVALRGLIDSLTFVYQPEGYGGADERVYIVRRGAIRAERHAPRSPAERAAIHAEAKAIFERRDYGTNRVRPTQVAEILLLARWFRLRPAERERVWGRAPAVMAL
jgi:excinuclease ABC subunit C